MKLLSYLTFDGNCEEAINFYKDTLKAKITMLMRFSEAPGDMGVDKADNDKIMHAVLEFDGNSFMASDSLMEVKQGNNFHLSLNVSDEDKAQELFQKLAGQGKVIMPFDVVFWGGKFGMLQDRFGIQWMISNDT